MAPAISSRLCTTVCRRRSSLAPAAERATAALRPSIGYIWAKGSLQSAICAAVESCLSQNSAL